MRLTPLAVFGLAAGSLLLAGCSGVVALDPAPAATTVGCAAIGVRLPSTLGSARKRETNAQGTAAWGSPVGVVLRCGIRPPGPTTRPCFTFDGVDWVGLAQPNGRYEFDTFGRTPASRVVIDTGRVAISDALPPLSTSIAQAVPSVSARCTGPDETASAPPEPSPSPSS